MQEQQQHPDFRASEILPSNVSSSIICRKSGLDPASPYGNHSPSAYACSANFRSVLVSALTSVACRLQRVVVGVLHDDWHAFGAVRRCGRKKTCISQALQLQVSSFVVESAHARVSALPSSVRCVDRPQATARMAAPLSYNTHRWQPKIVHPDIKSSKDR